MSANRAMQLWKDEAMITDAQVEEALAAAEFATNPHTRKWMRAALEAAERAAWRPMSEAPKDQPILVRFRFESEITAAVKWDGIEHERHPWKIIGGDCHWSAKLATHYRPLPLPPGDAK